MASRAGRKHSSASWSTKKVTCMHREAVMKLAAKSNAVDVSMQLMSQHTAEKRNNRVTFLKLLECVRYLAI